MAGFNFANRADIEKTLEMIRDPRQKKLPAVGVVSLKRFAECHVLKAPVGGIPARSGTTPGSAECTPYYIDVTTPASPALVELKDNDGAAVTVRVYHMGSTAVAAEKYIVASYCGNALVAVAEDCG